MYLGDIVGASEMMAGKLKELGGVKVVGQRFLRGNNGEVTEKTLAGIVKLFRVRPVLDIVSIGRAEVSISRTSKTFELTFSLCK